MLKLCYHFILLFIGLSYARRFPDWLVHKTNNESQIVNLPESNELLMTNGLISRRFSFKANSFSTIEYYSHEKKSSLLRGIGPEAIIKLNGITYNVGGFITNTHGAYLNRTALNESKLKPYPRRFTYKNYEITDPKAPFPYSPKRGAPLDIVWPPKGKRLDVHFIRESVLVTVHYEIYDGIPLLVKWVSISSSKPSEYKLDGIVVEFLRLNMQWASPSMGVNVYSPHQGSKGYGWLDMETDEIHSSSIDWSLENQKSTPGSFQPRVIVSYKSLDMDISLENLSSFESFKVHELLVGSSDSERKGLARKRKIRLLAPHTQENPIFFHMTSFDSKAIKNVIDQMSEVGFEMLIYSFGSGFNLETNNLNTLKKIRDDVSYANSKGIEIGGYDLIALSRHVGKDWMAMPQEESACFASGWKDYLFDKISKLLSYTNMTMLETDGPYSGYSCNSLNHSHHVNERDSIFWQSYYQKELYSLLRKKGIYINQPDLYFYSGGSKTGMGYNEEQYSLPRWIDMSVSRQGMYDDMINFIPTQGWMFVPLEDYQGGGAAAAFEPLTNHAKEYEWALSQYLGAGVAACYRGKRLYDSPATKSIVQKWVKFYKKYRDILTSDTVQVRRGDMQSLDSFLHVNPFSKGIKGLAMVFNPTSERIKDELTLPLYYTGIEDKASVSLEGQEYRAYTLDRHFEIEIPLDMKPISVTWILIQDHCTFSK